MRIGIDIDDTLCNTKALQSIYWKEYFNNQPDDEYTEELPFNINHFGYEYINGFWNTYRYKLFSPSIKDNVKEVMEELRNKGCSFYIVTSRPKEYYDDLDSMIKDWLGSEGLEFDDIYTGVLDKGQFIVDNNIDLLIDDDERHINRCRELNKNCIHFNDEMDWLRVRDIIISYL